jgi:hypothetical protein
MLPSHTLHCLQSERRQHTFFPKILLHLISFFYPICLDYFTFIWIKPTGGFFFCKNSDVPMWYDRLYLFPFHVLWLQIFSQDSVPSVTNSLYAPFLVQHESYAYYTNHASFIFTISNLSRWKRGEPLILLKQNSRAIFINFHSALRSTGNYRLYLH